jgi:predicted NUDIX family NTP pyrophosphohydrolase
VEITAMPKESAGLLLYRKRRGSLEVFLVHPGGPFWVNKDDGAWSIPKGEFDPDEDPLKAAKREFREETGLVSEGEHWPLQPIRQRGGKIVYAWAAHSDLESAAIKSNTFSMEWPPKSGKQAEFPEVDRAEFFDFESAKAKINPAQYNAPQKLDRWFRR